MRTHHDYYADTVARLVRGLERRGALSGDEGTRAHIPLRSDLPLQEMLIAFYLESLAVGLRTDDPLIALRCYGQASAYRARVMRDGGLGGLSSDEGDAILTLRNRLEAMLSEPAVVSALKGKV